MHVIANLSLNFQQHHIYLFETPTRTSSLSPGSHVWSLAASLSTANSSSSAILQHFPKHGTHIHSLGGTYIIVNHVMRKLLLACQVLRLYNCKVVLFFHLLLVFLFKLSRLRLKGFSRQQYLAKIQYYYFVVIILIFHCQLFKASDISLPFIIPI